MKNSITILFFLLCTFCFSCDDQVIYNHFESIDKSIWEKKKALSFIFDIQDTTQPYHVILEIRNSNLYPYQNLILGRQVIYQDSLLHQDTLNITLADQYGRFLGKGISLFETDYPLYRNHHFIQSGTYQLHFYHLMYRESLPGMHEIGIRLETSSTLKR
ncbi:MAG: gliding motility lipoprotein GldH [Tannerellaceae bacterium]|nr:gliding motility lipoprotein GldH [Tannerellaceae bacterium]